MCFCCCEMSLTKLLNYPMKLFKKDVITFLIIRRHDISNEDEKLRYISVKSNASISTLRQKIWYLLDLPDYCEEMIILKTHDNVEISLMDLRKGNDPQHPFILEVWPPVPLKQSGSTTTVHNMLTMGDRTLFSTYTASDTFDDKTLEATNFANDSLCTSTFSTVKDSLTLNKIRQFQNKNVENFHVECKKSELSCRLSSSSILAKLQGKKNKDNFTNVLLKIQNDLVNLSNKLSSLENRIPGTN